MSFGWSISDIAMCARVAFKIYVAFKKAPAVCADFGQEMLYFHRTLSRMSITLKEMQLEQIEAIQTARERETLEIDKATLATLLNECTEFLAIDIIKKADPSFVRLKHDLVSYPALDFLRQYDNTRNDAHWDGFQRSYRLNETGEDIHWVAFRRSIQQVRFSRKTPVLLSKLQGYVAKLTAFNVQLIQSHQFNSLKLMASYSEALGSIDSKAADTISSQARVESSQSRIAESQTRLEIQLQQILSAQQRKGTPLLLQSLDASSLEGHRTWMELERLLRDEGITPEVIKRNRGKLIAAMKQAIAGSGPESFHTVHEFFSTTGIAAVSPCSEVLSPSTFGTAPPSSSGFPTSFLKRHEGAKGSLEGEENVTNGVKSLMHGMDNSIPVQQRVEREDYNVSYDVGEPDISISSEELDAWPKAHKSQWDFHFPSTTWSKMGFDRDAVQSYLSVATEFPWYEGNL